MSAKPSNMVAPCYCRLGAKIGVRPAALILCNVPYDVDV